MPNMKETRDDAHPPTRRNNTVTQQGENQAPKPRTPNERDESSDSQAADATSSARRMGALAKQSVDRGERDTTKGAELDATYHRVHEESAPAPQDRRNRNQE